MAHKETEEVAAHEKADCAPLCCVDVLKIMHDDGSSVAALCATAFNISMSTLW
jgi:hypothetical protein